MPSRRARYVTVCQQSLVTAVVLVVGVSAAGVRTLDIVPAPSTGAAQAFSPDDATVLRQRLQGTVDTTPVTPKVREVKVTGVAPAAQDAPRPEAPAASPTAPAPAPRTSGRSVQPDTQPDTRPEAQPARLVARSAPQPVKGYATVGVTWKHGVEYDEQQISVQVRTETDGRWSGWTTAEYHDEHGPDGVEAETARDRPGTDAVVVGDVDQVQMRASTTDGSTPPDLELAVIDPGTGPTTESGPAIDTATLPDPAGTTGSQEGARPTPPTTSGDTATTSSSDTVALSAMKVSTKPTIYSRAQWGANESLRDGSPSYGTVKAGFIHHTVNANTYTEAQVPALLRGIYAYHTQSRGWSDIGYNFLVDRFGRIWEGRYGGVSKAVVGAHTLGYNEVSFAMSAIGNYDVVAPPQAVLDAYAQLFAWKLSSYDIRADSTKLYVKNRYLQAINGHRDVGQTACPGKYLYAKIPAIRAAAQKLQTAAQNGNPAPTPTPTPTPTPPVDDGAVFTSPTQKPRAWAKQPADIDLPAARVLTTGRFPDLVTQKTDGTVQVLPTAGQTDFTGSVSTAANWKRFDLVVAVGDVTGDKRGDVLARAVSDGTTRVYAGDGTGKVATTGTAPTTAFAPARTVIAAGDWNRDGRNDVISVGSAGKLRLFTGRGDGTFTRSTLLSSSWSSYTSTAAVGDVNGDGRVDLAARRSDGYLYLVPATSRGTLGTPVRDRALNSGFDTFAGSAADLTGDAVGDLVLRSASSRETKIVAGLPGSKPALSSSSMGPYDAAASLVGLTVAPMTGTRGDLVGLNASRTALVVVPNNGRLNLWETMATTLRISGVSQVLSVGDWNDDGHADLVTREDGGDRLVLRRGNGKGGFGSPTTMADGWKPVVRLAAVGDVTGDGDPDLAGKTRTGDMVVYPGNGKAGFEAPRTAPATLRTFNQIGSGSWAPAAKGSRYNGPGGGFVPAAGGVGIDLSAFAWVIGPGDVDGDGRADLVVRDKLGKVWVLPGTGRGVGTKRLMGEGFTDHVRAD